MPCRCVWYGGYTLPITPIPVEMTPRRVWLCPQDGATALHLAAGLGVPAGTLEKILAVSGSAASLIDNVCGGFMQRAWVWCTAAVCTLTWGLRPQDERLPIHYAVTCAKVSLDCVQVLLKAFANGAKASESVRCAAGGSYGSQ